MKVKSKSVVILLILSLFIASVSSISAQQKKETIAVLDFNVISGISASAAPTLTNIFRSELINTKVYDVLERSDMESILKEQAFSLSGACNSAECAVEIGQLLSAEKMVVGDIGKIGETYSITLRLVDVSTGKIEGSWDDKFQGKADGLLEVFKTLAKKIAGTYEESSNIWWYVAGAAVVGGAAAAVLLGGENGNTESPEDGIGNPPSEPEIP